MKVINRASEVESKISVVLGNMSASDRRVAQAILDLGSELGTMSISDLARHAGTATSTVSRSCQAIGFKGFQDLRHAVIRDAALTEERAMGAVPDSDSTPAEILRSVCDTNATSISGIPATLDGETFGRAVALIRDARRVVFVGVGTSHALALEGAYRLTTIGVEASAPVEMMERRLLVSRLDERDALVAISYSGSTRETIEIASKAKRQNVPVVVITGSAHTPLTELASESLIAAGSSAEFRVEALSSRIAHLTILDALYVAIALSASDRADEALESMAVVGTELLL